jgi:DNA polymerase-3 subunit chi
MNSPRVTFHDSTRADQLALLCRYASNAVERRLTMLITVRDAREASEIDSLLWTWAPDTFVPHAIWRPGDPGFEDSPVLIAEASLVEGLTGHVVLQLAPVNIPVASGFANVVDFVDRASEMTLAAGRQRYGAWRKLGVGPDYRKQEQERPG